MWAASVGPPIRGLLGTQKTIAHFRIRCFGVGESDLEAMLPDLIARQRYPLVGITVSLATITLRITAEGETAEAARASMQPTIDTIHECLGELIFGYEEDELHEAVVRLLRERRQTLAVVEWGTSGLLSHWLSEGATDGVWKNGLVLPNQHGLDLLASFQRLNPVADQSQSEPLEFMAKEGLKQPGTDYVLVVGPHGAPDAAGRAAGNVDIVLAHEGGMIRKDVAFGGHPEILKPRLAKQALNLLRLHLVRTEDDKIAKLR